MRRSRACSTSTCGVVKRFFLSLRLYDPYQYGRLRHGQATAMSTSLLISPVSNVAILAAALVLQQIHGTAFAVLFLQPYGFPVEVISELLNETIEDKC